MNILFPGRKNSQPSKIYIFLYWNLIILTFIKIIRPSVIQLKKYIKNAGNIYFSAGKLLNSQWNLIYLLLCKFDQEK